ncbi:MAG: hypothetical protein ACOZNI_03785 [Myxococcota bacterium]
MALLLTLACAPPLDECADLREETFGNLVQPFEIAVDPDTRTAWATGLASKSIAAFDLDTGEEIRTLPLADRPLATPDVVLDAAGVAFVGSGSHPALVRYDVVAGERTDLTTFSGVDALVPYGDGVFVLGRVGGARTLARLDGAGEPVASREIDATGLVAHPDGVIALAEDGILLDEGLAEIDRCALPFPDTQRGAVLADGRVVVADDHHVGFCDGEAWEVGNENKDVIPWGSGALVLDRIGDDDPNLGVARFVDDGVTTLFATGKNTGYGAIDPVTGLLWANSEGTSEVLAFDPTTGERVFATRAGTFVDGVTLDPDDPGTLYLTGRLSDTIARVDSATVTAWSEAVRWPYSPVVAGERLWVLSQTDGVLVGLDRETLAVEESHPLDVGPNPLLTFGSVTWHATRGTLFAAESHADALFEVSPGEGVVNRWDLGGPAIADADEIGELLVRWDETTGDAYVSRSNDGRVVRVDPDAGVVATAFLPVADGDRMDLLRVFGERGRAWLGPYAFDLADLGRRADLDLPVARLVGPWKGEDGEWVALAEDGRSLVHVGEDGGVDGELPIAEEDLHATVFRLDGGGQRVLMGRSYQALACWFDVDEIR